MPCGQRFFFCSTSHLFLSHPLTSLKLYPKRLLYHPHASTAPRSHTRHTHTICVVWAVDG